MQEERAASEEAATESAQHRVNTGADAGESDPGDVAALRRPLHLLLWGMIFSCARWAKVPDYFFDLTAAALLGFAAIGMIQATENRIARAGLTFVAMIALFEAISGLLPPSGHPWIAMIRVTPSFFLPAVLAHAMIEITDQFEWPDLRRSWTLTFGVTGGLALAGMGIATYAASKGWLLAEPGSPATNGGTVVAFALIAVGLFAIVQYLSSLLRTLGQVRREIDGGETTSPL